MTWARNGGLTAVVFAFVVIMALFLFAVDTSLAYLVKFVTGRGE